MLNPPIVTEVIDPDGLNKVDEIQEICITEIVDPVNIIEETEAAKIVAMASVESVKDRISEKITEIVITSTEVVAEKSPLSKSASFFDPNENEVACALPDTALVVETMEAESKHTVREVEENIKAGAIPNNNNFDGYESEIDEIVVDQAEEKLNTVYAGWLVKQGHLSQNWKQRYCIINKTQQLVYYRTSQCAAIKGRINLTSYGISVGNNAFALYKAKSSKPGHSCYYFVTEDALSMNEWIAKLSENGIDKDYHRKFNELSKGWYPGKFLGRPNPNALNARGVPPEIHAPNGLPGRILNDRDEYKVKVINSSKYEVIAILTADANGEEVKSDVAPVLEEGNVNVCHQMLFVTSTKQISIHTTIVQNYLTILYKLANGDYVVIRKDRPITNGSSWEAFDYMFVQPNLTIEGSDYISQYL